MADRFLEDQTEHLTQRQLARRWKISHRTLERQRYLRSGVRYLKIGGRVLYRLSDVEAYETERERPAAAAPAERRERRVP